MAKVLRERRSSLRTIKEAGSKGVELVTLTPMPLIETLHLTYISFIKSCTGKTGASTSVNLPTVLPTGKPAHVTDNDADSVNDDGESEDLFYDADDVGKLDTVALGSPPSIIFDTDSASQKTSGSTLTVPAPACDNETRISAARKVSVPVFYFA